MSNAGPIQNEQPSTVTRGTLPRVATVAADSIRAPLQFVGFWAAVAMPFLYVPVLLGNVGGSELTVFAVLVVCHVAALVLGHGHNRD